MSHPEELTHSALRAPDQTREALLGAAEQEIHLHGFQAASLANILKNAGVTKGALYHHFANKQALGYAVLDEIWGPQMRAMWIEPLMVPGDNPIDVMIGLLHETAEIMSDQDVALGCPINNLAQEMSPIDEGFKSRLNGLLDEWRRGLSQAVERGRSAGMIRTDVDAASTATFLVASLEGCIGMAKNAQSKDLLLQCGLGVITFLNSLRP